MPLVTFEPTVPAREQPQTHALDCSATGIGTYSLHLIHFPERLTVWETIKQTWRYGYISEVSEQVTNNNGQQIKDTRHATWKTTILGLECVEIQFDLTLDVHAPWK